MSTFLRFLTPALLGLTLIACGSDSTSSDADTGTTPAGDAAGSTADAAASPSGDATTGAPALPTTYAFGSKLVDGVSSVSYTGATLRHVLISDLKAWIGGLTDAIDSGTLELTREEELMDALDVYTRFGSYVQGSHQNVHAPPVEPTHHLESVTLSTTPTPKQKTYGDLGEDGNVTAIMAGNEADTDYRNFDSNFDGWPGTDIATHGGGNTRPEALAVAFFQTLEANALGRVAGTLRKDPAGNVLPVYVTETGLDLQQLIQKFLLVAGVFHQGTDVHLDEGLTSDNSGPAADGAPYTALEHAWDMGFGYFGAARDYADYSDDEIAGKGGRDAWAKGHYDSNADGMIDLESEINFGNSVNAAKRDRGANSAAATDLTADAFDAFLRGRALISAAVGRALTGEERAELEGYRDQAIKAWEESIAATVVHYINDTIGVMATIGTAEYSFVEHAKVWSELKGFALGLQFNPRSPLSETDFVRVHDLVGTVPVLEAAGAQALDKYRTDLLFARGVLGAAYGFDGQNLGDENGQGGW